MKTMATFVLFSVVMASSLQQVFAIDCLSVDIDNIMNCDDCIRCGGNWCKQPADKNGFHCSLSMYDNWCPGAQLEVLPTVAEENTLGGAITPSHHTTTVNVNKDSVRLALQYDWSSSADSKVEVSILNTTQTNNIKTLKGKPPVCADGKCTYQVSVRPEVDFCLPNSGKYEFVNMKVRVDNLTEEAVVKYHVPCACACSDDVEKNAKLCNGNGNLACGVCACHKGWSGTFCEIKEQPKCDNHRGDVQCTNPYKNDVDCSGNGYCGPCDTCICYDDREGSQYFQEDNYCADLCMTIASGFEQCLRDMPLGKCKDTTLTIQPYNETSVSERDEHNRRVWVKCEETIEEINYEYVAMKDYKNDIFVMKISNSNSDRYVANGVNIMLPSVLGVIALVAAVAAVAGYMVWKAKGAAQPQTAHYDSLNGPEGCAGINPLYKPPTSSYNNPMWTGAKV